MNPEVDFLVYVAKALVDNPDDVNVVRTTDDMGVLLTLDVNPADMGRIIGREGVTAQSVRSLLRTVGMRYSARVNLKINDPRREESNNKASSVDDLDLASI
jgi:predicted RNA-binding protein YlqC (UPF0109 family)